MPGKLGDDFDVNQPSDSSLVKQGALWIRDIKARVKSLVSVMFDPETGEFKDNAVSSGALQNSGVVAGSYTEVTVNEKGLVTLGANPVEQKVANIYRAVFTVLDAYYDTDSGKTTLTGSSDTITPASPSGSAAMTGSYTPTLDGFSWVAYTFRVPTGVRRLKATIVGGGGGGHASGGGGGGADHLEVTFPVTPLANISVIVGNGGGVGQPGGVSLVNVGSLHAEAAGGGAGGAGTGGSAVDGDVSGTISLLRCSGADGAASVTGGASGSYLMQDSDGAYGRGGDTNEVGNDGLVVLEWFA